MATGVNVKMGVSGVAQFKRDINVSKESMKTLKAQMELTEEQFKATGDSQTYMKDKAELLNVKMKTQKGIIENAKKALEEMNKNGVDKSSKAFQDMQRAMIDAQTELVKTEGEMNNLSEDAAGAEKSTQDMNTQLKAIGKGVSWQNVSDGLGKITDGLEKAAKKAWKLGKTMVNYVLGAGSWADELKTESARTGISVEDLQRMQKTAQQIDTDVDTIIAARKKMQKAATTKGGKKTIEETLGLSLNGQSAEDLFWEVGEALLGMGESFDKEAAAQQIFGKGWNDLLPLFQAGREEYDKMNDSWSVISQEQIDSLGKMDDEYQKMISEFDTLKMTALSEFAEPMAVVLEEINGLLAQFTEWLKSDEAKQFVQDVVKGIQDALDWIIENKDGVVTALGAIGTAFAGMKIATFAANVKKVVDGFNTLWQGANKPLPSIPGGGTSGAASGASSAATAATGGGLKAALGNAWTSAGGASALIPGLVALAAIAPAEIARGNDEARWKAQQERWSAAAEKLTGGDREFVQAAAKSMTDVYRPTGDAFKYLMGLNDRTDLQKMQLHNMVGSDTWSQLMSFWQTGGENMADFQITQLFNNVADAYDAMLTKTEENTKAQEKADTEAANAVKQMPSEVENAIKNGMKDIRIYLDGNEITAVVSSRIAADIEARVNP